jgi:ribonuclease P/MRP protein subunit POP5
MVRLKSRYLLFEIIYPDGLDAIKEPLPKTKSSISIRPSTELSVDARKLTTLLKDAIELNFGDYGLGAVSGTLAVKYFSQLTSKGIVRVARQHFRLVWAALTYINKVGTKNAIIRVIRVSGTIKKCEIAAIQTNRLGMLEQQYSTLNRFHEEGDTDMPED